MSSVSKLWATARPRQWIKSTFIFAPALFSLRIFEPGIVLSLLAGAIGFSLIASAIYTFNDIINRFEDSLHPLKKNRPLAAGEMKVSSAAVISVILFTSGMLILVSQSSAAALYGLGYAVLMVTYTLILRRLFILDVIAISCGFVLRIETGAKLIDEPVSHWLLLCTFAIALFLGMIKRRQELAALAEADRPVSRRVLVNYPDLGIVDGWVNVLAGITVLCYALYTVDAQTIAKHHTSALIYTIPLVLYGIFRYQSLACSGRAGEDPAILILSDLGLKLVILCWIALTAAILYMANIA